MEEITKFFAELKDKMLYEFTGIRLVYNIVDVILIALLLYAVFAFLRKNRCGRLIKYICIATVILAFATSSLFPLRMTGSLAGLGLILVNISVVLLFQQELRRTLWKLSSPKEAKDVFTTSYDVSDDELKAAIDEIVRATINMAKKDTGALMLIAPGSVPPNVIESGTPLDSHLSCQLIECLFNTKAPLHDGAVIIRGNRIVAAGCFLPLTQNNEIDKELGTRHRAAIGVTETSSVMAIIVSEESGVISVAIDGIITRYYDSVTLTDKLMQVYGLKAVTDKNERKFLRRRR